MKILIVNASPLKNGNISKMLNFFLSKLNSSINIEKMFVYDLQFKVCTGCMKCRQLERCILPEDDAHHFGEKIKNADIVVIAAPVYWGNMPGNLKQLFDRNVFIFMQESKSGIPIKLLKDKKGIVFTTCTTPSPFDFIFKQSRGLINAINEIFKYSGIKNIKNIVYAGTKNKKNIPAHIEKKLYKLANVINEM